MRTPSIQSIKDLGVAQLVARYLGVVEAVGSSPVTQTRQGLEPNALRALFLFVQKVPAKKLASFLVPLYSR